MIKLPSVIGMPPDTYVSEKMVQNSMPILRITPSEPVLQTGLTVFRLRPAIKEYKDILKYHGFELNEQNLRVYNVMFIHQRYTR